MDSFCVCTNRRFRGASVSPEIANCCETADSAYPIVAKTCHALRSIWRASAPREMAKTHLMNRGVGTARPHSRDCGDRPSPLRFRVNGAKFSRRGFTAWLRLLGSGGDRRDARLISVPGRSLQTHRSCRVQPFVAYATKVRRPAALHLTRTADGQTAAAWAVPCVERCRRMISIRSSR